jgi:flagellar assembly protein FliH
MTLSEQAPRRWDLPAFAAEAAPQPVAAETPAPRVDDAEQRARAVEEGYAAGLAEGRRAAQQLTAEIAALLAAMATPFREHNSTLLMQLTELIILFTGQVVRRELTVRPGDIKTSLREALAVLEGDAIGAEVYLHPEDRATVEDLMGVQGVIPRVRLLEDSNLLRGGCRVQTASSVVEVTAEQRLLAIAAQLRDAAEHAVEQLP